MAWVHTSSYRGVSNKTSGTTLSVGSETVLGLLYTGFVIVGADNYLTGAGSTVNCASVTDGTNTWLKIASYNNAAAAAASAEVSIWACEEMASVTTITANFTNAVVAKAMMHFMVSPSGTPPTYNHHMSPTSDTGSEADGAGPVALTLPTAGSLRQGAEYFFIYANCTEAPWVSGDSLTLSGWTSVGNEGTSGAGAVSNIQLGAMYLNELATTTSRTWNGSWSDSATGDNAGAFAVWVLNPPIQPYLHGSGYYGGAVREY